MPAHGKRLLSPEEYLAIERDVPIKHEYYRGEMFAMAGASREHNLISGNIAASLYAQLANRPCEHYQSDMRVKVSATGLYVYPDVVTCQKPQFEDDILDTLLNPQLIIEVGFDSTEKYDRMQKFDHYRRIESLREYVLVVHNRPHIDRFARGDDGKWSLNDASGLDGVLELPIIGCQLKLADVYAKVELPPIEELNRAAGIFGPDEPRPK
jgi:Uma2 family endonuclease